MVYLTVLGLPPNKKIPYIKKDLAEPPNSKNFSQVKLNHKVAQRNPRVYKKYLKILPVAK
jgi:hypothetical protein